MRWTTRLPRAFEHRSELYRFDVVDVQRVLFAQVEPSAGNDRVRPAQSIGIRNLERCPPPGSPPAWPRSARRCRSDSGNTDGRQPPSPRPIRCRRCRASRPHRLAGRELDARPGTRCSGRVRRRCGRRRARSRRDGSGSGRRRGNISAVAVTRPLGRRWSARACTEPVPYPVDAKT